MTHRFAPLASVCAGALLALGMASAHAAPITYRVITGTDAAAAGSVRLGAAPEVERALFLDALDPAQNRFEESFELFGVESTAPLLLFGATAPALAELTMPDPLVPLGSFGEISDAGGQGRFNTSPGGSRWWEASGSFSISFTTAIEAFAFYATDLGDFEATLTIEWFLLDGSSGGTGSLSGSATGPDGTLDFWGLTDARGFDRVSFTVTQVGTIVDGFDFIGFDDLIAGYLRAEPPPPQGVSEPLTLALVGLGLAGIALTRRRRR